MSPLDPRIPLGLQPPAFNNPFEQLAQIREQQQTRQLRQQAIQSNQALEEGRRQDIAKQQRDEAAARTFYEILAKPGQTADTAGEEIRLKVPSLYGTYQTQRGALDKTAAELRTATLNAKKLEGEIATKGQEYAAPFLQMVEQSGYDPNVFNFALTHIQSHFEDFPADDLRQRAAGGPEAIKQIVDSFKSPAQQSEDAQRPGQMADSAVKTQVAAGTVGGLTPSQQAQNAQGAQRIALERGQLGVAQAREAREKAAAQQQNTLMGGTQTGASPTLQLGQRDDAYLKTLPTPLADKAKALVEGRLQLPTRFTKGDTYWQSILDAATKYDPSFDAVNYNGRAKTRQGFTSGKEAQTVNALNTVTQHLDRLSTSAEALNNSWSPTYNTVANFLSRHVGSPTVTNFETDKKAVVDELTRAWRQAGGTESDIKSWSDVLDAANSPTQLHGAIGEMSHLLEGKLSAMETQYQQGMGTAAVKAITPQARAVLTKLQQKAGDTPPATGPTDGDIKPLDANGAEATFRNGRWIRTK